MARNALTAVSLAIALGVSAAAIAQGLSQLKFVDGLVRLMLFRGKESIFNIASGDFVATDRTTRIGYGVTPDEDILPRQSDLMKGKDTVYEAALAWVRSELKP